jgi:hypothetical protein
MSHPSALAGEPRKARLCSDTLYRVQMAPGGC